MSDEFPKNLGGWSGPGRTAARTLRSDNDDFTWLRKRRFGAEARNKGGHLVVKVEEPIVGLGGWYSLGIESGAYAFRGSYTARGDFFQRPGGPYLLTAMRLYPRGDGSAYAVASFTGAEFVSSVFGVNNRAFPSTYYITKKGDTPEFRPTLPVVEGRVEGSFSMYTRLNVFPATSGTRRAGIYEHAICYAAVQEDQHKIAVTFDDGVTQRHTVAAYVPDHMIAPVAFNRLGPSTYLGMGGTYMVTTGQEPPGYDRAAAPGLFFFYTLDAGVTWQTMAAPALIAHEQETLAAVAAGVNYWSIYNNINSQSIAYITPLSRTKALVWALVGAVDTYDGGINFYENYRIRYGVADLEAGTVSLVGTMYEMPYTTTGFDYYGKAYPRWDRMQCIAPGGGVLVQYVDADYPANWTTNPQLFHTTTGALTPVGTLPFQAGKTGVMGAVSATKLFMPAYDTEHSLFESVDLGITWTKRATISDTAAAPVTGPAYRSTELLAFQGVAWLLENGIGKNATPAAPWLSDDRLTPPN